MGAKLSAGGFSRGKHTKKHDRREHRSTQVQGSHKEITPLLLLYCLYIFGSMEVQQWWLPSSLLEEEEALSTHRLSSDQPPSRAPCATLYSGGQGHNGHLQADDTNNSPNRTRWWWQTPLTLSLIALDVTLHPCTLNSLDYDLTTMDVRTVLWHYGGW
jgi:hypothetical protein